MENWTEPSNQSGGSDPPKIGSLELCDSVDIHSWLLKPSCPFDFSELSNLNVDADADLLATIGESPAAATIETLTLNSCMLKFYGKSIKDDLACGWCLIRWQIVQIYILRHLWHSDVSPSYPRMQKMEYPSL
jgi:hypothetical protein